MNEACDSCLRRGLLVGHLAPRIAGLLGGRPRRATGLLALAESDLLDAAAGSGRTAAEIFLDGLDVVAERERLFAEGVGAVCTHSPGYPPLLRELPDPPSALFVLGRSELLEVLREEPAVAIVGTRNATPYGTEVACAIGRGLGAAGVPVVSGLALGVDAAAHRGCLAARGLPVAVVACGPDVVYPRRHRRLHEQIVASGVILSELPPRTQPFRWAFPARNRIMAGLTRMALVVEAADPSGSLITADFAEDLGRCVGAVPGRVTSTVSQGTNNLLKQGAVPITSTEDVLDELFGVGMRSPPLPDDAPVESLDPALGTVLAAAERCESVEAIARAAGRSTAETRAALGRLEAEGHLVRRDLGGWERAAR